MKTFKLLIVTILVLFFVGCGNKSTTGNDFSLKINNEKKAYKTSDELSVILNNKENKELDSVIFYLNSERLRVSEKNNSTTLSLENKKLGIRTITAKIYSEDKIFETSKNITILSSIKPKLYTYKILETYPHDIKAYTQGLEFKNDTMYESTGQYKESSLRKTNYKTGEVLQKVSLSDQYFGEGLTILNDKIYQLTWREKTGFIYDLETLEKTGTFVYGSSKEGWGLCHDGTNIYKSDGTDRIWILNKETLAEEDYIEVFTNTSKIKSVNELEWVDGKIYANVYEQSAIAIIDPSNGAVEGVIDLGDLKDNVTQHPDLNVLNGIAYKGEKNILYVTGKNWDKMFKVEIIEK